MFGGLEVLQCYNPHKTERFCTMRCYKGATKVLQGATTGKGKISREASWAERALLVMSLRRAFQVLDY